MQRIDYMNLQKIIRYLHEVFMSFKNRVNSHINAIKKKRSIKLASRQFKILSDIWHPYFIVGISGSLHLIEICLQYIPSDVNLILILNGMESWEKEWIRKHLQVNKIITIEKVLEHGIILDLILDNTSDTFGILDYDCFVFDPSYFSLLRSLDDHAMINALFASENPNLNIEFPQTFIMYINTPVINYLRRKYHVAVSCRKYSQLSKKAKQKIATIGIDKKHYPEDFLGKEYFDTFRALISLGIAEGFQVNFLEKFNFSSSLGKVFHVGSVSNPNVLKNRWQRRGSYFWRRLLEVNKDNELKKRYYEKFGHITPIELLSHYPSFEVETGMDWFNFVEKFINREFP